ncbi:MAG TPA: MATE family efflux transporter [Thermoanaerobaculia bacterium]|nr:MATE family efflux transporter [Thermoanaerobaculia bacterium]
MEREGAFARFWRGPGGGREVLDVGLPLMLSQASYTVQVFVDRLFLTWYSTEAMAGAMAGGLTTIALVGLFAAVGEYLTAFVAQYHGAGRRERIGPAVWQGIYFAVGSGLLVAALAPFAGAYFALAGHSAPLLASEATFARILMRGSTATILMATLASFFAGRGKTRVVLLVNVVATAVNCVLDGLLIFGRGGFPRMGVAGAALATVISQVVGAALLLALFFTRRNRARYATASGWRFDRELFARLLRFGLPAGLQLFLEVIAFSLFLLIVGRIGTDALAASALAFNLNMIVFMPMLGLSVAVSSLVGRYLGAGRPDDAARATFSAFGMSVVFMATCGAVYVLLPRLLLLPYAAGADARAFAPVGDLTVVLLRFVAFYSIFDMMNVVFAGGLKGAGDTRFPLLLTAVLSIFALLLPAYLLCVVGNGGVLAAWSAATAYVALLGPLMLKRFLGGRWRTMSLIERKPAAVPAT